MSWKIRVQCIRTKLNGKILKNVGSCASFYNNCYRTNEIEYNDLVENGDKMYLKKGERVVYMGQDITAEKDVYVTLYGANHEHIDYLDELAVSLGLR